MHIFSRFPQRTAGCIFSWIQCGGSTGNMRVYGEGLKTIAPGIGERSSGRSCARTVWNVYGPSRPGDAILCTLYPATPANNQTMAK